MSRKIKSINLTEWGWVRNYVYLKDFIKEHKIRLRILKDINKRYRNRKITFQLSILGIESLAKYYKPSEKSPSKRVKLLLSKLMGRKESKEFYELFRNCYVHDGFTNPILDWEDYDNRGIGGMSEKDVNKFGVNVDYPRGTVIAIYEELIKYIEQALKDKIKYRIIKQRILIDETPWTRIKKIS